MMKELYIYSDMENLLHEIETTSVKFTLGEKKKPLPHLNTIYLQQVIADVTSKSTTTIDTKVQKIISANVDKFLFYRPNYDPTHLIDYWVKIAAGLLTYCETNKNYITKDYINTLMSAYSSLLRLGNTTLVPSNSISKHKQNLTTEELLTDYLNEESAANYYWSHKLEHFLYTTNQNNDSSFIKNCRLALKTGHYSVISFLLHAAKQVMLTQVRSVVPIPGEKIKVNAPIVKSVISPTQLGLALKVTLVDPVYGKVFFMLDPSYGTEVKAGKIITTELKVREVKETIIFCNLISKEFILS